MSSVTERITSLFSRVSSVTADDVSAWLLEAEAESGFAEGDNDNALVYLAAAVGYGALAAESARYFSYTDNDETVDKSMIFANYANLSASYRQQYEQYRNVAEPGGHTAYQTNAGRADGR